MSWNRIVLPLALPTCADTIEIGNLAWDCYRRANQPEGFAIFHADELDEAEIDSKRIIYFSPVASEVCREISEKYSFEPCKAPARDETHMAYVFGDPKMMGQLRDTASSDRLVVT